jgi:quinol monooxygenase YgiN
MTSQPVLDLMGSLGADPTLLTAAPVITPLDVVQGFSRPEFASCVDPYITVVSIQYKDVVSDTEKNELETLSYGIYKNREHAETVKVFEAFRSEEYFHEVHGKSAAVQENVQKYGDDIRVSKSHISLRHVAGYLGKGA